MSCLSILAALLCGLGPAEAEVIDPLPRPAWTEPAREWTFAGTTLGWQAQHDCQVTAEGKWLAIHTTGGDPYLHTAIDLPGGRLIFRVRVRSRVASSGGVFWTTDRYPARSESRAKHFTMTADGQWHEYSVVLVAEGRLQDLRFDPKGDEGETQVAWIRLDREHEHPLSVRQIEVGRSGVRFTVRNEESVPHRFTSAGKDYSLAGGSTMAIERPVEGRRPLEPVTLQIEYAGFAPLRRTIFVHNPDAKTDWIAVTGDAAGKPKSSVGNGVLSWTARVAKDGSMARIERDGRLAAVVGPLVSVDGELPRLRFVAGGPGLRFEGDGVTLALSIVEGPLLSAAEGRLRVAIDSPRPCEGPVVRPLGALRQGLLSGVEYLGPGEKSSSTLDIETEEHLRFAPDPLTVTMPLMAMVTDRASVAVTWSDMAIQPVFATPNFFDWTDDHRMALRGKHIEATVRVSDDSLEENVLWAVAQRGLPPLPQPPRSTSQQWELCLAALRGPLASEKGWGHCVEPRWPREPYAAVASTIWRLSGQLPQLANLVPGGTHVPNDASYFVTGHADAWLRYQAAQIGQLLRQQQPDGSFRYQGEFRRGHFEDTASGVCARPAAMLLEHAWLTGDAAALQAGLRSLEFMKRFRVPRGAQFWELSIHTPDQLASAYLVSAYVRGYELTGKKEYLALARRWAVTGLPFVYLWSRYPVMLYATTPVYGATHWVAPNWIGLPVQWVGGVYAYALTKLAPYDRSFDWNQVARGILIAAEQMQIPDGPLKGLLPDSFTLRTQHRNPAMINPCSLVSLRMALDGRVDSLTAAADGPHRIAAPFPVTVRNGQAHIRATAGCKYQVLIDGHRIVNVTSRGEDVVPLVPEGP
jgi:hypothetical protein